MSRTENTTAAAHLAAAAAHEQAAAESFDRCDTDGFLSQWGSMQMSALERRNAEIASHGGVWKFERLSVVTLDGRATDGRIVETRYGKKVRLDSRDAWVTPTDRALAKYGMRIETHTEVAPAKAVHWAPKGARGLSGASQVCVVIVRADGERGWQPAGAPDA
jgi:hypothetical protein